MVLAEYFGRNSKYFADKPFLSGLSSLTYAQYVSALCGLARFLELQDGSRPRLATVLPFGFEQLIAYGLADLGLSVVIPVPPQDPELARLTCSLVCPQKVVALPETRLTAEAAVAELSPRPIIYTLPAGWPGSLGELTTSRWDELPMGLPDRHGVAMIYAFRDSRGGCSLLESTYGAEFEQARAIAIETGLSYHESVGYLGIESPVLSKPLVSTAFMRAARLVLPAHPTDSPSGNLLSCSVLVADADYVGALPAETREQMEAIGRRRFLVRPADRTSNNGDSPTWSELLTTHAGFVGVLHTSSQKAAKVGTKLPAAGVTPQLPLAGTADTMAEYFRRNEEYNRDKEAFVFDDGTRITFAQYCARARSLSHGLSLIGVEDKACLAILAPNCPELMDWFGVAELSGRSLVPINWRLNAREIAAILSDCHPAILACHADFKDLGEAALNLSGTDCRLVTIGYVVDGTVEHEELIHTGLGAPSDRQNSIASPDDALYVIYTSGTTGRPKGVVLDQRGQVENTKTVMIEMQLLPDDSIVNCLPFYHVGGKSLTDNFFARGCLNIIMKKFDPVGLARLIQEEKATTVVLVPSMVAMLLENPDVDRYDLSSLRTIYYSGSPMPEPLVEECLARFGNILFQSYGMTETGPSITQLHKEDHSLSAQYRGRLRSCGLPVDGVEVSVRSDDGTEVSQNEIGEVTVRSRAVMWGYLNQPEATAETISEGWLKTGDLGQVDQDGYLYIVGRKKDMIISGGENIYSREVESVIETAPGVAEVAVIGLPDQVWGEAVTACVVRDDGSDVTQEELVALCQDQLASYKKPKHVLFMNGLPRNAIGKVQKDVLKGVAAEMLSRPLL